MDGEPLPVRAASLVLPVIVAGAGYVAVLKTGVLGLLAIPIDGGATWRCRPIFGANKTWRGVVLMTGLTALATGLEGALARRLSSDFRLGRVNEGCTNPWTAGAIVGLSCSLAELPNSFVKRRVGIAPGERAVLHGRVQYLVDQLDSVFGCLLAMRWVYRLRLDELVVGFALGIAIHVGFDRLLYVMGVKRV